MNKHEMITVIIPTYNREKTIKRAIDSVLNQTYSNIEIIIIDDCSMDHTADIVNDYKNPKIRYHRLDKNSGACVARNKGIELANGTYIAFQDSDDEWFETKLEKQIKKLKDGNADVTFCALNYIDEFKKEIRKIPDKNIDELEDMTKELLKENFISTQTLFGKKEVFEKIKFDETLPRFQDWDLVIRLSKIYKISYLDEILVNLYIQKDSITKDPNKKVQAFEILYKKYNNKINSDSEIKYCFKSNMALARFNAGMLCTKDLKESLKEKFNFKVFVCYVACVTRTNKIVLRLESKIRK